MSDLYNPQMPLTLRRGDYLSDIVDAGDVTIVERVPTDFAERIVRLVNAEEQVVAALASIATAGEASRDNSG